MKYTFYIYCMTACLFFQACDSADRTILSQKIRTIDSVEINDSIVIKDKLAINNTIAGILVNSKDSFLQIHQDTVFFQDKKFSGTISPAYPYRNHWGIGFGQVYAREENPLSCPGKIAGHGDGRGGQVR